MSRSSHRKKGFRWAYDNLDCIIPYNWIQKSAFIFQFELHWRKIKVANHLFDGYIDVGDRYWRPDMLVTCLRRWWPIYYIAKISNIMTLLPTLSNCHHHKMTNIPLSPTLLSEVRLGHSNKLTCSRLRENNISQCVNESFYFESEISWVAKSFFGNWIS